MNLEIIADLWASYERDAIPAGASRVQVQETKRAFYAGARGLFGALLRAIGEGEEPTEQDLRVMDAIHQELAFFAASVAAGRN